MIKEAEKSLSLLSTNWRHRRGSGIVPVWIWRPEIQVAVVEVPDWMQRRPIFQLKNRQREQILPDPPFVPWRPPMDWVRSTHNGYTLYFTSLLIQMLILPRNSLIDIPRIMFNQISGHPVAWSDWHLKLTITLPLWVPKIPDTCFPSLHCNIYKC